MSNLHLQLAAWNAAFLVAVLEFRRIRGPRVPSLRFLLGLPLGAAFAHLGWALLHVEQVIQKPEWVLAWTQGVTVLLVPLGLLVCAPWAGPAAALSEFLAAAFRSLPLALSIAKLGCAVAGCCHGIPSDVPWAVTAGAEPHHLHPTAFYEALGFALLYLAVNRVPDSFVPGLFLVGFGLLRILVEPLRATPPLGPPTLAPTTLAWAWLGSGLCALLWVRSARPGNSWPGVPPRSRARQRA